MATTENIVLGNGGDTYSFSFPYLKIEDVQVELQEYDTVNNIIVSNLKVSNFTIPGGNPTTIIFDAIGADTVYQTAPDGDVRVTSTNGYQVRIRIFRSTDIDATPSTFFAGSAIRAQDLNTNFEQILNRLQESDFSSNVDMNNNLIRNLAAPTVGGDAANKTYVDTQDGLQVSRSGDSMSGVLNMGGNKITNLAAAVDSTDAVSKNYVDARLGDLEIPGFTRWRKVATAGQTVFSGAGDYGGTLSYSATREQVFLNGAQLQRDVDYTAGTGTSITLTTGAVVGDIVEVICVNNLNSSTSNQSQDLFFVQSGTGATTRTVESKLRDVVSVKDFSAVGDAARLNQALATGNLVVASKDDYVLESNVTPGTGALFIEPGSTFDKPERLLPRGKASNLGNGVNLWRFQDRVFVGGANTVTDKAAPSVDGFGIAGDPSGINSDYLERGAALISSSAYGGLGGSFAARQSLQYTSEGYDAWTVGETVTVGTKRGYYEKLYTATTAGTTGATPPSHTTGTASDGGVTWQFDNFTYMVPIGLASVADADVADGHSAWALYLEGLRRSTGGSLLTAEIAVKNKGSDVTSNPYNILPGGSTVGIWLAGGGDPTLGAPANPSTAAISIIKNGHTWNSGIVFGSDAITSGGAAIKLAANHTLSWYAPDGNERAYITSDRSNASAGGGIKFSDNTIDFRPAGEVSVRVSGNGSEDSFIELAGAAASTYISAKSDTSTDVDLILASKGIGKIKLSTALQFAYSGFTPATTPANFTADRYMVVYDAGGTAFYIPARLATW